MPVSQEYHPSVSEDMMVNVLNLLPPRSLARFTCVSKQWQTYISWVRSLRSKYVLGFFYQYYDIEVKYMRVSVELPRVFYDGDLDESVNSLPERVLLNTPSIFDNDYLYDDESLITYVIASSKGFILCTLKHSSSCHYYIYNPSTRQLLSVPEVEYRFSREAVGFICYESSDGVNQLSYRIVRVAYYEDRSSGWTTWTRIETFSSEVGKWLCINFSFGVPTTQIMKWVHHPGVAVLIHNNDDDDVRHVFYWFDRSRKHIVAIDIVKETYWLIKPPPPLPSLDRRRTNYFLGVSGDDGYLYFTTIEGVQLTLWMLKAVGGGNNEEWIIKYKEEDFICLAIQNHHVDDTQDPSIIGVRVIGIHPASPNLVYVDILSNIMSFDFQSREVRLLDVLPPLPSATLPSNMIMHECYEWPLVLPPLPSSTSHPSSN